MEARRHHFEFEDGRRFAGELRTGKGVLLEFGAHTLRALASRWNGRIAYASRGAAQFGLRAALVRPDGVVGWASDVDKRLRATTRWFGEPGNGEGDAELASSADH